MTSNFNNLELFHQRPLNRKRLIVGLTGGPGCGKSTVSLRFKQLGAFVICADSLARQSLEKGNYGYKALFEKFGGKYLLSCGGIDKAKLADDVFEVPKMRNWLENTLHPRILRRISEIIKKCGRKIIVVDAPLLFESGIQNRFDITAAVYCDFSRQLEFAIKRGWSGSEVRRRIKAQLSAVKKACFADAVILNDGSLDNLFVQVDSFYSALRILV